MNAQPRTIFSGMKILVDEQWLMDQIIVVQGNKITAILPAEMKLHHLPAKEINFPDDFYLVPGFIDLHIHGADGSDIMDATFTALNTISHALAKEGVTHFLATTMTATDDKLEKVLQTIAAESAKVTGAKILGVHLEGPFIANDKRGAQGKEIRIPNNQLFQHLQNLANDNIKLVTLAPELENAIAFIRYLVAENIRVSIGHTNATYNETIAAIAAGCTQATHLFNAMRGITQREPGATAALLLSEVISAEIIADGIHLHPTILELTLKLKTVDKLLLITDAMRAKCLRDGEYELGGQSVQVKNNIAQLKDGTLAGSVLRMPQAIKNMTQFTNCTLIQAIQMATKNPAATLNLQRKGKIDIDYDADLVVLNNNFDVVMTLCEGKIIYNKNL